MLDCVLNSPGVLLDEGKIVLFLRDVEKCVLFCVSDTVILYLAFLDDNLTVLVCVFLFLLVVRPRRIALFFSLMS